MPCAPITQTNRAAVQQIALPLTPHHIMNTGDCEGRSKFVERGSLTGLEEVALPEIDLSSSFNVAVKHLFRHLNEPRALRKNPLVRHFFRDITIGSVGRPREQAVIERIRELIRQSADRCRDDDQLAGKDERALRQHAIINLQCLEGRSTREVATLLGISCGHCYRERADICRRVARSFCKNHDTIASEYFVELDEFRVLMDRTMHEAASDDMNDAFRKCEDLIRVSPSANDKIESLRASVSISLRFGNIARAEYAYSTAQALLAERSNSDPPSRALAEAYIDIMGSELTYYCGNAKEALHLARRATLRLGTVQTKASPHIRELYVESLYQLGTAFCNADNLERAYECIAGAEARVSNIRAVSSRLRTRIVVAVWRLRNHLLMSSKSWRPSSQRLEGLVVAFEDAYARGGIPESADALDALTEYHAFAGNDAECLRTARLAALLAKQQPNERMQAQISVSVATSLLSTHYWKHAPSLLPDAKELDSCDAYHNEFASYFAAKRALRLQNFQDAWTIANREDNRPENASLRVCRRLLAAVAAHELGRQGDAGALIDATIPIAESVGSAPILKEAYGVAASVTGDLRFKRAAGDLALLFTS
jgi:hypothetical protein